MNGPPESEIIQKFRNSIASGDLSSDVKVVCRVSGGMPSERVEEAFTLHGDKKLNVSSRRMLGTAVPQEASEELEETETRELLQQIGAGLDSLVTRSEARFLPGSLVGTITIEIEGEEATLYFLADEEEQQSQGQPLAPEMNQAIQRISDVSNRLLKPNEVKDE